MTGTAEPSAVDAGPAPEGLVDEIEQVTIEPGPVTGAAEGGADDAGAAALDAGPPDDALVDEIEAALLDDDEAGHAAPSDAPAPAAGSASGQVDAADAGGPPPELTADVEALDDD